jgi:hypothetical protein
MAGQSNKESTMVLVTHSWRAWAAGLVASLVVFAVIYFTVIQPSTNTANQTVKAGLSETQQAIKQAQHQINSATGSGQASAVTGHAKKQIATATGQAKKALTTAGAQANKQLSVASKLAACVAAAGTDTSKLQACQVKYTS